MESELNGICIHTSESIRLYEFTNIFIFLCSIIDSAGRHKLYQRVEKKKYDKDNDDTCLQ